jgi:Fe-S-cluster containining protein
MSKQIQDMSEEEIWDLPTLDIDDIFPFRCKACGKCCKSREDILLTPYDVFRLARYLIRTPEEIIGTYCRVYEGQNSHFPVVRVIPHPPEQKCPFLRKKKCTVHAAKPVLCRVYPLARISGKAAKAVYYFNKPHCNHGDNPVKVRDWIADVASEESERAAAVWAAVLRRIIPAFEHFLVTMDIPLIGSTASRVLSAQFGGDIDAFVCNRRPKRVQFYAIRRLWYHIAPQYL